MKRILFTTIAGLLMTSGAWAGTLATVSFQTLPGDFQNGTYNGGVGASIVFQGGNATPVSAMLYCDDYADTTYVPSTSSYTMSAVGSNDQEKFGTGKAATYQEAALLMVGDGAALGGLAKESDGNLITLYQYALWDLFEGNTAPTFTYNGVSSSSLVLTAQNDVSANASAYNSEYNSVVIFTPNAGNPGQEFLGVTANAGGSNFPNVQTPEPATWATLFGGVALMGLIAVGRFTRRRNAQSR